MYFSQYCEATREDLACPDDLLGPGVQDQEGLTRGPYPLLDTAGDGMMKIVLLTWWPSAEVWS